jgi:hypothetical protein
VGGFGTFKAGVKDDKGSDGSGEPGNSGALEWKDMCCVYYAPAVAGNITTRKAPTSRLCEVALGSPGPRTRIAVPQSTSRRESAGGRKAKISAG